MKSLLKKNILGIAVTSEAREIILEYILDAIAKDQENFYIVTPNPEIIVYANTNLDYKNILNEAELALCDGIGVLLASKILGKPLRERLTGTDLMIALCSTMNKKPITVGFLGGRDGIAAKAANCLKKINPYLEIKYIGEVWPLNDMNKENLSSETRIDILFVAFGFPKQEVWISNHIKNCNIKVMIGVGGAFDYIGGNVYRAPGYIRKIGMEWLFRVIMQPWRIKRQLSLLKFVYLIIEEKIKKFSIT